MFKISFYVPETHLEMVKNALFDAGAGKIGNYDRCCWQTRGTGQYRPLENSHAFKGAQNQVSQETEYLVEMVFEQNSKEVVVQALLQTHPYETPAYAIWPIIT